MASASRARAQAIKARNERERERHNRNSVKPPHRCEALAYAMGLGPCVDVVRSCAPRGGASAVVGGGGGGGGGGAFSSSSVLHDDDVVRRTDAGACWFVPTPLRWLCCGADTALTLGQEHGFNFTAPRTKGKGDFGQVHDLSVHVPRMQAQAAIEERRNLYIRVAIAVILGFLTAASLWMMMPVRAPDAQWACDTTSAVAARAAVDTWARSDGDRDRIFSALLGRARTVQDRHRYLHCPFSTAECETGRYGRVGIASAPASAFVAADVTAEAEAAAAARAYPPNTSPGFVQKFTRKKGEGGKEEGEEEEEQSGGSGGTSSSPSLRHNSAAVSVPRGSLGTCAVVGRAWPEDVEEAVRSSRGARIDAHDTVIRLQRRGPGRRSGGEAVGLAEAETEETHGVQVVDAQDEADLMGVRTTFLFMERVATVR